MIFVVGGRGLTGSAIVEYIQKKGLECEVIQKENKEKFWGRTCDVLIFANGNAVKFKANQEPLFDYNASVSSIVEYVHKIDYKMFILLSTVDVYNDKSNEKSTSENITINENDLDVYGFHKLLGEKYVQKFCKKYLIFRMGGLVGKGLKKNPVFYFIKKDGKVSISPNSEMNFINTKNMAEGIFEIFDREVSNEIFNLASKNSVKISQIKDVVGFDSEYSDECENTCWKYVINTEKIQKYVTLPTTEESIKNYFDDLK